MKAAGAGLCWSLLPEDHVPEEQPARVHKDGDEGEDDGAVEVVVQQPLGNGLQEALPALQCGDGVVDELLVQEDAEEKRGGRSDQNQQGG